MAVLPIFGAQESMVIFGVAVLSIWEIFWKGIALWKAAKAEQKGWFVAMLVLNTAGILPILYIFVFQKGRKGI